jgi:hypothetical protein
MIVADLLSISSDVDGLQLAAIFGLESARPRIEQLSDQHGIPQVHTDYERCLADAEVDTVYIGLPNSPIAWLLRFLVSHSIVVFVGYRSPWPRSSPPFW